MIDFHTHILPHLDDGAKNTAMAKAMLEAECKQGVTDILFTPHYYGKRHSPSGTLAFKCAQTSLRFSIKCDGL